ASQPGVLQAPGMAGTGVPVLSAEQAVLSVTLMCARTHWPASQPGGVQAPGMAVTGLPALSTEHAVLSVTAMCGGTPAPASQPGVLQAPGMALTGLPALSAEQAVLSVTLMCARTHCPASQPGVLQLPGKAVTGLPALSVEHGVLSVTLVVVQSPFRPVSTPVPCRFGSQTEVRHAVLAGHGWTFTEEGSRPDTESGVSHPGVPDVQPTAPTLWDVPHVPSPTQAPTAVLPYCAVAPTKPDADTNWGITWKVSFCESTEVCPAGHEGSAPVPPKHGMPPAGVTLCFTPSAV